VTFNNLIKNHISVKIIHIFIIFDKKEKTTKKQLKSSCLIRIYRYRYILFWKEKQLKCLVHYCTTEYSLALAECLPFWGVWLPLLKFSPGHIKRLTFK
jgi:hypothetical protein